LATSDDATDWFAILDLYDQLRRVAPSPVVELNRAVAVAQVEGLFPALQALDAIDDPKLSDYHLLHATRADVLRRLGEREEAAEALRLAVRSAPTAPERRYLERRLAELVAEGAVGGDG
ncbi:MAG: RNA polymerase sigma factor, partial [Acidobacteriota bacterium]